MEQNRKYFGMTPTQIAILAGLAGAACLLFGVGGWLFLRGGPGLLARAPQNTPVPQATATMVVIPTASPTETPTPVPYEMLIPQGWVQFKTALVEIWLPKGFKQEKKSKNAVALGEPELEMMGFPVESSLYPMIVAIYYEPLSANSLDDQIDRELAVLSTDERVTERRKVTVNGVEAVRILVETRIESFDANLVMYIFLDGGTIWIVQYVAQINDFYTMSDLINQSVKTFRVVR